MATPAEVLTLIDGHKLHGIGIGYVDAQLLAATKLTGGATLWTNDRRLAAAASRLGTPSTRTSSAGPRSSDPSWAVAVGRRGT